MLWVFCWILHHQVMYRREYMTKEHFILWDYDSKTWTEYERIGQCNACGECCKKLIRYSNYGKTTNGQAKMGTTTDRTGKWSEYRKGKIRRFIKILEINTNDESKACSQLVDGKCAQHSIKSVLLSGKLALCDTWPIIPDHVSPFKNCSFSFNIINSGIIKDEFCKIETE